MSDFQKLSQIICILAKVKCKIKKEMLEEYEDVVELELIKQYENSILETSVKDLSIKIGKISLKN